MLSLTAPLGILSDIEAVVIKIIDIEIIATWTVAIELSLSKQHNIPQLPLARKAVNGAIYDCTKKNNLSYF